MKTQVIKHPVLTEKSTQLTQQNVYSFVVDEYATKSQIKTVVEDLYKVKVGNVKTIVREGKIKKTGRKMVMKKLPNKKIAYVTVKSGKINIFPQS